MSRRPRSGGGSRTGSRRSAIATSASCSPTIPIAGTRMVGDGRRPHARLLQAPGRRRGAVGADRRGPAGRRRGAPRRHVRRAPHQHHRGPGRPPRGPADAPEPTISRSTGTTWWPTCTGCSTGWVRWPPPSVRASGPAHTGKADHHRGQHRHRGLRSRTGHGLRKRCSTTPRRTSDAGSCRTSTRSTCTTRPTTSTRPRPCSWSARRRSPPWRP